MKDYNTESTRAITIKRFAIESINRFSDNKYCLIKELWRGDKLINSSMAHSKELPPDYPLKG